MTAPPPPSLEQVYLDHLPFIDKVVSKIAYQKKASADEAEEFASELKLKLLENNYAIFAKFQGRSELKTYLITVAANAFRDFRNRRWGKYRPSAEAKRLGEVAIRLEEVLEKEGRSIEEACEILRSRYQVQETRQQLLEIWKRLPHRTQRHMTGEDELGSIVAPEVRPEQGIFERELQDTRARVDSALQKALKSLAPDDLLLVNMFVIDGVKLAEIARIYCLEQKPLYRQKNRILEDLRSALEQEGVRWEQVADLLNRSDISWGPGASESPRRTGDSRPSI